MLIPSWDKLGSQFFQISNYSVSRALRVCPFFSFSFFVLRIGVCFRENTRNSEFNNELRLACCLLSGSNLELINSFRCIQDRVV